MTWIEPRQRSKKKLEGYKPKKRYRLNSRGKRKWLKGEPNPTEMMPSGGGTSSQKPPEPKITIKTYLDSLTPGFDDCPHCKTKDVDLRSKTTRVPVKVDGCGQKIVVTCGVPSCGQKFWSGKPS